MEVAAEAQKPIDKVVKELTWMAWTQVSALARMVASELQVALESSHNQNASVPGYHPSSLRDLFPSHIMRTRIIYVCGEMI